MEKTDKPSLNIDFLEYDKINIQSVKENLYPKIKKNDYFLLTPLINSVINLKRKRSTSF